VVQIAFWNKRKPLKDRIIDFLGHEEIAIQYPRSLCQGGKYTRPVNPDILGLRISLTGRSVKNIYPILHGHNIRSLFDVSGLIPIGKYYGKVYYILDDTEDVWTEHVKLLKKSGVLVMTLHDFIKVVNPRLIKESLFYAKQRWLQ